MIVAGSSTIISFAVMVWRFWRNRNPPLTGTSVRVRGTGNVTAGGSISDATIATVQGDLSRVSGADIYFGGKHYVRGTEPEGDDVP